MLLYQVYETIVAANATIVGSIPSRLIKLDSIATNNVNKGTLFTFRRILGH